LRPPPAQSPLRLRAPLALAAVAFLLAGCGAAQPPAAAPPLPERLSETGLYADPARHEVAPGNLPFSPQYPLWTDGATKRRWIRIPDGAFVDASDPDAWAFPVGTRLWKEFAFERRVETRMIERTAQGWRYATYRWTADESDAFLAPEEGVRGAHEIRPGVRHDLPGRLDCLACHASGQGPVLGFSALQLSPLRDPLAPHAAPPEPGAVDLRSLVARGLVRGLPGAVDPDSVAIPAASARERAARGWLHANCAACHNPRGPLADLGLDLAFRVAAPGDLAPGLVGEPSRFLPRALRGGPAARVVPGAPEASVLLHRVSSRDPAEQMPPLGSRLVDDEARALLEAWIGEDLAPRAPAPRTTASLSSKE
jgi:hypothetical protein